MTNPNRKIALLCGAALVALPSALHAQSVPDSPAANEVGEVIITGSRVVTNGASAPTPVTVVTQTELLQRAASSIPDALNTLPAFAGSNSPAHNAIANPTVAITANNLNLRDLGPVRVLTLFDGLRLPPEGATGLVDANLVPQMLIQGVDIVTAAPPRPTGPTRCRGWSISGSTRSTTAWASWLKVVRLDVATTRAAASASSPVTASWMAASTWKAAPNTIAMTASARSPSVPTAARTAPSSA
jgi:hypothetical protein